MVNTMCVYKTLYTWIVMSDGERSGLLSSAALLVSFCSCDKMVSQKKLKEEIIYFRSQFKILSTMVEKSHFIHSQKKKA